MPSFNYQVNPETGLSEMVPVDQPEVEVVQPTDSVAIESSTLKTVFKCSLCGDKFPIVPLGAKHFHQSHEDLDVDKDSWREYIKETPA